MGSVKLSWFVLVKLFEREYTTHPVFCFWKEVKHTLFKLFVFLLDHRDKGADW